MDGNAAAAYVSYAFSQIAVIYPITPSSPMAEAADEWSANGKVNLFGEVPIIKEMQSEAGVAGALHGALTCGVLATSYTCSQGLLLMQPNMFKIAGELLPTVLHVSARALSTHALSIFGDHQDVMACRQTGFAFLCSSNVQETLDFAVVAHLATLKSSVPFVHFFDGFRTSHEYNKIDVLSYEEMRSLLDEKDLQAFFSRGLTPKAPIQRGTAQNPDVYFQNREASNPYCAITPSIVQEVFDRVGKLTGKTYHLFDYYGDDNAEYVIVMMGSGSMTAEETVDCMRQQGEKVGLIKVRLYRPFDSKAFISALPKTCKKIAVLDRTKEAGALGEPLYLDVCASLKESNRQDIAVFGGRYGVGMKEFTPSMCHAVFENLKSTAPKNHFTVGIEDDVSHTSLPVLPYTIQNDCVSCKFYGLGSDGTVGANKNTIKIIGEHTPFYVQAYFQYDSKKSGGATISHLRFGEQPIRSAYLIDNADFLACHNPSYLQRFNMLDEIKENGVFLCNCPWTTLDELNAHLPPSFKQKLAKKKIRFFVIDGTKIANETGLDGRTSSVMQSAFFLLNPSLISYERAKTLLKDAVKKRFAKKGQEVIDKNCTAIDAAEQAIHQIDYPEEWANANEGSDGISYAQDEYFQTFIKPILNLQGDTLPVSAFSPDGSVPTGTAKLEKHGVPYLLPVWIEKNCIQCNQCSFVCPHACIRPFLIPSNETPPPSFTTLKAVGVQDAQFRIQVSPHDCMGCGVCADVCPPKEKALVMRPSTESMTNQDKNWEYGVHAPTILSTLPRNSIKGSQFYPPLFEFSYACSGCGETSYIKVLTQLFGERMLIANATGCSSIYGGSSPSCPYTKNQEGLGPAWANSLFEDNAEFGYGMQLAQRVLKNQNSVWIIGGDGWAYDIGYGGLDHVLASGENVNVLVLDSEVYSNTGGQCSKATPRGATARFAAQGKPSKKKDLALIAMCYQTVYVAQVSMGANKQQFLNALTEAEAYDGPSLIIAYSPCIEHGMLMSKCMQEEKNAVDSGYWPLFRFHPDKLNTEQSPLNLDSGTPKISLEEFFNGQNRFRNMQAEDLEKAKKESEKKLAFLRHIIDFYNLKKN